MENVGAYEAKTHLPMLLKLVAKGETITITKHGVPVATLQSPGSAQLVPVSKVLSEIREFRAGHSLNGLSLKEMIVEGRK